MFGLDTSALVILFFAAGWFVVPAVLGAAIAGRRGRSRLAWAAACAALPLLVVAPLLLAPARAVPGRWRVCPACREVVRWQAAVCHYCRSDLPPAS